MLNRKLLCLILFLGFCVNNQAQDIHFSQFYHASNYINPSFNGLSPGINRFSLNMKNQWIFAKSPFRTYMASFENSWKRNKTIPAYFSTSGLLYYDKAGDGNFSTLQFSPAISYNFVLNSNFNTLLSIGVQPGIIQRSLDIFQLSFDNQFNGFFYDPSRETNEYLDYQTRTVPDLGLGAHYITFFDMNNYIGGGLSVHHINRPYIAMKGNNETQLAVKYIAHAEGRMYVKNTVMLPALYFARQGTHNELLIGTRAVINRVRVSALEQNILFRKNFLLGLFYRNTDALIFYTGFEYQNYHLGITYDVNISRLLPASQARGGIELSASYIWQKTTSQKNRDIPCPIF
jgi:type IX secretion system PorP/SprF family membrane protein